MRTFFLGKKDYVWALIFFVALISVVFLRIIINQQTFFSNVEGLPLSVGSPYYQGPKTFWDLDPTNYMHFEVPQTIYWAQELRKGHFAFWNPWQGNGQPLSASMVSGIYNPLKLALFAVFPYGKTFDFYLLLKFLIAGFGMYLFLKKLELSQQASLLGGAAYMFSGYFVSWITHWSLSADMMTPYILLGIEYLIANPKIKQAALLGIVWGIMVLSENPEAVIMITIFSVAYLIYRTYLPAVALSNVEGRRLGKSYIYFATALTVAFIISLPMLWDIGLFFSQSINGHNAASTAIAAQENNNFIIQLNRLLRLPVPLSLFQEINRVSSSHQAFDLIPTYIGTFILLLTVAALGSRKNNFTTWIMFFGFAILFFILVWIEAPPVSWVKRLPVFKMIIFYRYYGVFYFSLAALAAMGWENIKFRNISLKKFWLIMLLISAPLIDAVTFSRNFRQSYKVVFNEIDLDKISLFIKKFPAIIQITVGWLINVPYFYAAVIFGLTIFFCSLFLFFWWKKYYNFIFIFLVLELILYIPKLRDVSNFQDPYREPAFVAYLKSRPDIDSYRIYGADKVLMSQTATGYGLRNMSTFDGVLLRSYLAYLKPLFDKDLLKSPWGMYYSAPAELLGNKEFLSIFNLASVKYIISEKEFPKDAPYKLIYNEEVKIYENKSALPLAWIETDDGKLLTDVIIEKHEPNKVVLRTDAVQEGMLVLAETNYPGWSVYVDGQKKEIKTIHEMFRGVYLPKGNHEVVFKYWPLFTKDTLKAILGVLYLTREPRS